MGAVGFDPKVSEEFPLLQDSTVVDSSDVDPAYQSKVDRLENRVKELELKKTPPVTPPQADVTTRWTRFENILKTIGSVAAIVLALGGAGWALHSEFSTINERINGFDKRINAITMALKILGDSQGGKTKELVDDALALAKMNVDSGQTWRAQRLLAIANEIVAEEPLRTQNQDAAKELLATAKNKIVQIPAPALEQAGKRFIEAGRTDQNAWETALDFVSYRSFLNESQVPITSGPPREVDIIWTGRAIGNPAGIKFHAYGRTERVHDTARLETIKRRPTNPPVPSGGPQFIVVEGVNYEVRLDGYLLKNVIVKHMKIRYSGGPLILKNVYFVDCKFDMTQSDPGKQLSLSLLASAGASFASSEDILRQYSNQFTAQDLLAEDFRPKR